MLGQMRTLFYNYKPASIYNLRTLILSKEVVSYCIVT